MFVKIHKSYRDVVAICDSELIGKKFETEKSQLEIKENFFKGEEYNKKQVLEIIKNLSEEDATFNIVGEKSTSLAVESGIVNKNSIKKIKNIPFVLILA